MPERRSASINGRREKNKEKICIVMFLPNQTWRAIRMRCNILFQQAPGLLLVPKHFRAKWGNGSREENA
jgi:hypothetical protein